MRLFFVFFMLFSFLFAEEIRIFSASDMRFALEEIKTTFLQNKANTNIEISYGSSGKGFAQIKNGAKFDIFLSADKEYAEKLAKNKSDVNLYAMGKIVVISKNKKVNLQDLVHYKKIAIANPNHAPYGKAATEALRNAGIYEQIKDKLILADNVSGVNSLIDNGIVDVGISALSLSQDKNYTSIDKSLYLPINQALLITEYGKKNTLAKEFAEFILSEKAKDILLKYRFD